MTMITRREKLFIVFGGILLLALFGAKMSLHREAQAERRPRLKPQNFRADEYQPRKVLRPFEPIVNPPHVDAESADAKLQPNELVLGVELAGVARAYPINMLTGPSREIFNDTLGDRHIAATW